MNDELTIDYLHSVIGQLAFRQRLLVWDAYRCHTSEAVRAECSRLHLHTSIVPGGCTKFIQGPDVVWNACFKAHMHSSYDTWLSEPSLHEFTKGGNMKPPQRSLLCDWVRNSWECISREMIKESFMSCAITTSPSGSDDDKIHVSNQVNPVKQDEVPLQQQWRHSTRLLILKVLTLLLQMKMKMKPFPMNSLLKRTAMNLTINLKRKGMNLRTAEVMPS